TESFEGKGPPEIGIGCLAIHIPRIGAGAPGKDARAVGGSVDRRYPMLLTNVPKRIGFLVKQRIAVVGDGHSKLIAFYNSAHQLDWPTGDPKMLDDPGLVEAL